MGRLRHVNVFGSLGRIRAGLRKRAVLLNLEWLSGRNKENAENPLVFSQTSSWIGLSFWFGLLERLNKKNYKLNFLWPKMARLGPLFWPKNPPEKVPVGRFLAFFPRNWSTYQTGALCGANMFMLRKFMCFFCPLLIAAESSPGGANNTLCSAGARLTGGAPQLNATVYSSW